ncbi:MAG: GAF domain-containing protein [Myxococcales bacterium]|nr:GAF domain-containing protein [Myxococcales bacterium]
MPSVQLRRLFHRHKGFQSFFGALLCELQAEARVESPDGKQLFDNSTSPLPKSQVLLYEGTIIGVLHTNKSLSLLAQAITHQISQEQEKKALASEALDRYRELNLLYRFSDRIRSLLNVREIAEITLEESRRLIPSDGGVLLLLRPPDQSLYIVASSGFLYKPQIGYQREEGALREWLQDPRGEIVNSILGDPRFDDYDKTQIHTLIVAPLMAKEQIIGVLFLYSQEASNYTAADLKLLKTIASHAAPAIDNAHIYQNIRRLAEAFERFVPRQFLHYLGRESILDVLHGDGVQRRLTVLFTDIRDFTTLSEDFNPRDLMQFINDYLEIVSPAIHRHRGFIDKFIGDAVMALFPEDADDSLFAAIAMREAIGHFNALRQEHGALPIQTGIGVSTGDLMLGTIGSESRLDTTVIGDAANLAARIEGCTKLYKLPILFSEFTFQSLEHPERFKIRLIDRVRVLGRHQPVRIYEEYSSDPPAKKQQKDKDLQLHEEAVGLYLEGYFEQALQLFYQLSAGAPTDPVYGVYIARCEHFLQEDTRAVWSGVFRLQEK